MLHCIDQTRLFLKLDQLVRSIAGGLDIEKVTFKHRLTSDGDELLGQLFLGVR
jgi:hypothetical protein